jgi:hypothetical protein
MKEIPILMSTPNVKAIMEGRKTMTRRVMKPQPEHKLDKFHLNGVLAWRDPELNLDEYPYGNYTICPYGQIGDHLWVRETWDSDCTCGNPKCNGVIYKAGYDGKIIPDRWRPSIFMPRWASRITLEITGIKVERLQDISEADIRAEGFYPHPGWPEQMFDLYWIKLNGEESWKSNPYVWCITFKKLEQHD